MLAARRLVRRIDLSPVAERFAVRAASYATGALAAFWFCERLAGFVS